MAFLEIGACYPSEDEMDRKWCDRCDECKYINEFQTLREETINDDGLDDVCKECRAETRSCNLCKCARIIDDYTVLSKISESRDDIIYDVVCKACRQVQRQVCNKCNEEKHLITCFSKRKKSSSAYYKTCKLCRRKPKEKVVRKCKIDRLSDDAKNELMEELKKNWRGIPLSKLASKHGVQVWNILYWAKKQNKNT